MSELPLLHCHIFTHSTMRRSLIRHFNARKSAYPFRLSLLGVPEQVNIPIQLCQEQGFFSKYGVEVDYTTVLEGTGAMLKRLHHNEADLAITVTDGFIAGQAAGFDVQLVGTYVDSPLTWAVSVHPDSHYESIEDLFQQKKNISVGVSRLQSGSHTMASYLADQQARDGVQRPQGASGEHLEGLGPQLWQRNSLQFKELGSFANLREGIAHKDIDIFLWEVFTTKPYFDNGSLKYLGEVSTPWPAFSLVASSSGDLLSGVDSRTADMFRHRFLPALAEGAAFFKANTAYTASTAAATSIGNPSLESRAPSVADDSRYDSDALCDDSVSLIMKRFGHKRNDAEDWLQRTRYALPDMSVDPEGMRRALKTLQGAGVVSRLHKAEMLWGQSEGSDQDTYTAAACNRAISFRQPSAGAAAPRSITDESFKGSFTGKKNAMVS